MGHCEHKELLWPSCWMDMELILADTQTHNTSRPVPFTLWYYHHWWQQNKQKPWQGEHIVEIQWIGIVTRMYLKFLIILNSDRSVTEQYLYHLALGTWNSENRKKYTWKWMWSIVSLIMIITGPNSYINKMFWLWIRDYSYTAVGPCALDYSKTKTQDHFWTDPPADELVQRHRISSGHSTPPSCRRPALNVSHT